MLTAAIFLALAAWYIGQVPPFEGPDEPQHWAYIEWLAQTGTFPPQGDAAWETPVEQQAGQAPLYYMLASLPARLLDLSEPPATFQPNPHFMGPFPRDFFDNDNRAIHYPGVSPPLKGGWLAFYIARAVSSTFGVLLLVSVFGLAREVWPNRSHYARLVTLFVAATPQVIFLSSVVSNDVPVAALSALTLWRLAVLLRRNKYRPQYAIGVGLAFGLAVLAKVSAFTLAVPLLLALLWLGWSGRWSWREVARAGLWLGGTAFLVAGWWFIRSWILYGSPLGLETHDATPWAIDVQQVDRGWKRWWEVFRSFWIWLGWGTLRPDFRTYYVFLALVLLAVTGLGLAMRRHWRESEDRGLSGVLLALLLLAVMSAGLFLEIWMHRVIAPYGRLLYPALGAIAVLLVKGWFTLHPRLPLLAIGFLLALTLIAPVAVLAPAYAPPTALATEQVEALGRSTGLRFGSSYKEAFAELIQVRPLERSVPAGSLAPIRVCLETLGAAARDYSLLVQIIGPENRLLGSRRTYPGLGTYPTSRWSTNEVFCDVVQVSTPPELEQTLLYNVEVAMLDHETNQRVSIYDESGNQWPVAFMSKLRVVAGDSQVALVATHEPALQLVDYELPNRRWRSGQTNSLTLRWVAATPVSVDYQVFVHLRNVSTGEPVAQADGQPLDGWYPTSWWGPGEVIVDEREFAVPVGLPAGPYELYAGFYDLQSGERFGTEYLLETVAVSSAVSSVGLR